MATKNRRTHIRIQWSSQRDEPEATQNERMLSILWHRPQSHPIQWTPSTRLSAAGLAHHRIGVLLLLPCMLLVSRRRCWPENLVLVINWNSVQNIWYIATLRPSWLNMSGPCKLRRSQAPAVIIVWGGPLRIPSVALWVSREERI